MPIPKHLRHLYRGPKYRAWRKALVERSGDKCEQCKKPNGIDVHTHTPLNVLGLRMAWRFPGSSTWIDQLGHRVYRLTHLGALKRMGTPRQIKVVLTAAHLNHVAGDDRVENGKMLCQWCHLHYDQAVHQVHAKETRLDRKDAARPLLQEAL